MKQKQCLTDTLREQGIASGIDVEALDKEFNEIRDLMDKARINVRKERGWIKHFFIILFIEGLIPPIEYIHPEEKAEYQRLRDAQQGGSE